MLNVQCTVLNHMKIANALKTNVYDTELNNYIVDDKSPKAHQMKKKHKTNSQMNFSFLNSRNS